VGGEFDKFGHEVVEKVDTLDSDVEFGRTILGNLLKGVENGLALAVDSRRMDVAHLYYIHILRSLSSGQSFQSLWPPSRLFRSQ
jgi:hypothetical protein